MGRPILQGRSVLVGKGESDIFGLQALVSLNNGKLYALTFNQNPVPLSTNGAEVNKDILALIARNKSESLRRVEPLYRTDFPTLR